MKRDNEGKRVGIWIRVSTEDQVKGESPEHHEKRARLYAEAKGWNVIEVYRLDALSGKTVKEYPETKRMLKDVRDGRITGLIFSKLARLARNTKELLEFADSFSEHGADLISLAESIDTSTPAGRLFYTMIAAMAEWEREEIAERVRVSVPIRAKLGKPLGGAAPFGYAWKEGELVVDPKEAPVRKLMYELFAEEGKVRTVARLLNDRGYRTRNGSLFSGTTVRRLLQDPTAKGLRRANYTTSKDNKKAWQVKPEEEWIHHEVASVVSEELWEAANENLRARRETGKRPARTPRHLFAGVTFCTCGRKMYVPSNTPKYVCQGCRMKIPTDDLEAIFSEELRRFFFSPEEIEAVLLASNASIAEKEELLRALKAEDKKVKGAIDRLYDLYQAGEIDKKGFGERYAPLLTRREQCENELPALEAEIDVLRINTVSHAEVVLGAQDLYSRWPSLAFEEKRRIVETITERIVVGDGEVEIDLYYAPSAPPSERPPEEGNHDGGSAPPLIPQDHGNSGTQLHSCVPFLPCTRVVRRVLRPEARPVSFAEHFKAARVKRGLRQKDAAIACGVTADTIRNWERGRTEPTIPDLPAVTAFIGKDLAPPPVTLGDELRAYRRKHGLTIKKASERVGVSDDAWALWEKTSQIKDRRCREEVESVLVPSER